MTSDTSDLAELREQLALGHRLLHHYGLAAYQGHVSARVPGTEHVLIRAHPAVSNAVRVVERQILERAPLRYRVEALTERLDALRGAFPSQ